MLTSAPSARDIIGAAQHADLPRVKELHKAGADLNAIHRGYRPLHALLQEWPHQVSGKPSPERLRCLDWLLKHGADPELPGAWPPARALIIAAFVGAPEYMKHLLAGGALRDAYVAAAMGEIPATAVNERDPQGLTALMCAAGSRLPVEDGTLEVARYLLQHGADPAVEVRSWSYYVDAIYFAANAQRLGIFGLLLDYGVDPTHALTPALWNGGARFAALGELALAHGADPDRATAGGQPLLNNLIRWGQLKPVFWLLEHGASPNLPDQRGWTAAHQAASRGNRRMLCAVIEAGADLALRGEGGTPLEIAQSAGRSGLLACFNR